MPHQGPQPKHLRMIKRAARRHGIPPSWLYGLWGAEHGLRTHGFQRSSAGAQGPFQFMPATARSYGINPYKFGQAANAAAKYLATYKGRGLEGMYRAYNAGPAGGDNPQSRAHFAAALRFMRQWPGNVDLHPGSGPNGRGGGSGPSPTSRASNASDALPGPLTGMPAGQSAPLSGIADPAVSARRFLRLPEQGQEAPSSGPPAPNATLSERLRSSAVPLSPSPVQQSPLQARLGLSPGQRLGPGGLVVGSDYVRDGKLYRWDPRAKKYVRPGSRRTIRQTERPKPEFGSRSGGHPVGSPLDRPGVPTSRAVRRFVERLAGVTEYPIEYGTGSQHSRMTSSGNVSDHWVGRAIDLPASGRELRIMGTKALRLVGVSRAKARQMAFRGGIYNINHNGKRYQIIVRAPDHWDHLHVGIR